MGAAGGLIGSGGVRLTAGVWGAVTQTDGGVAGMYTPFGGGGGGGGGLPLPDTLGGGGGAALPDSLVMGQPY